MAVVFTLAAPGGNGAALPATITGQLVTGTGTGGADYVFNGTISGNPVSNAVYLTVPNQGTYHDSSSFRVLQSLGDTWMTARFVYCGTSLGTAITPNQSEQYVNLALRAGTTLIANGSQPNDGYMLSTDYHASGNALTIYKVVGGGNTQLAIATGLSFNATNRDLTVEFWVTGTGTVTLKARQYNTGSPAPDWQVTVTDASSPINGAGFPWLIHANGSAAANKAVVVAGMTIDDTTAPVIPAPPTGVAPHPVFHHLRRR